MIITWIGDLWWFVKGLKKKAMKKEFGDIKAQVAKELLRSIMSHTDFFRAASLTVAVHGDDSWSPDTLECVTNRSSIPYQFDATMSFSSTHLVSYSSLNIHDICQDQASEPITLTAVKASVKKYQIKKKKNKSVQFMSKTFIIKLEAFDHFFKQTTSSWCLS